MMKSYSLRIGGQTFTAQVVEYTETKVVVELNGNTYEVELTGETTSAPPAAPSRVRHEPPTAKPATTPSEKLSPQAAQAGVHSSGIDPAATGHGAGAVTAPIPGAVKQILVAVGDEVTEGTVVVVLEAMKMENEITARVAGKVSEIRVGLSESVQEGQLLIQIEVS